MQPTNNTTVKTAWSAEEVAQTVADYLAMLHKETNGIKYNKAAHRRELAKLLNDRDKAIEFKHQNISAILQDLGKPYIKGYKPLSNYQNSLKAEVIKQLNA